jgi:hypothetical protein
LRRRHVEYLDRFLDDVQFFHGRADQEQTGSIIEEQRLPTGLRKPGGAYSNRISGEVHTGSHEEVADQLDCSRPQIGVGQASDTNSAAATTPAKTATTAAAAAKTAAATDSTATKTTTTESSDINPRNSVGAAATAAPKAAAAATPKATATAATGATADA